MRVVMLLCHSLREITWQHPSQWRAMTMGGRPVYVRYKWGELSVHVGPAGGGVEDVFDEQPFFEAEVGHRHDSQIDWTEVARIASIEIVNASCPDR